MLFSKMLNTHTFAATTQIVSSRGANARISISKRLNKFVTLENTLLI